MPSSRRLAAAAVNGTPFQFPFPAGSSFPSFVLDDYDEMSGEVGSVSIAAAAAS